MTRRDDETPFDEIAEHLEGAADRAANAESSFGVPNGDERVAMRDAATILRTFDGDPPIVEHLREVRDAVRTLSTGGLSRRALVILLDDLCDNVGRTGIKDTLDALEDLDEFVDENGGASGEPLELQNCPRCGSDELRVEKRPNGYTECIACNFRQKSVDWPRG